MPKLVTLLALLLGTALTLPALAEDMSTSHYQQLRANYPEFEKAEAQAARTYAVLLEKLTPSEVAALERQHQSWIDERGALVASDDSDSEAVLVEKLARMSNDRSVQLWSFLKTINRAAAFEAERPPAPEDIAQNQKAWYSTILGALGLLGVALAIGAVIARKRRS